MRKVKSVNYDVEIHNKNNNLKTLSYFFYDSYFFEDLLKFIDHSINCALNHARFLSDGLDCWVIPPQLPYDDYPSFFGAKCGVPYRVSFDKTSNAGHAKKLNMFKQCVISCVVEIFYLEK